MAKMTTAVLILKRRWRGRSSGSGNAVWNILNAVSVLMFLGSAMALGSSPIFAVRLPPINGSGLPAGCVMFLVILAAAAVFPYLRKAANSNGKSALSESDTAALQKSAQKLQLHLDEMPMGAIEWDTQFRVAEWNPSAEIIFGYSRQEAIGRYAVGLIIPREMNAEILPLWRRLLTGIASKHHVNENITKSGRTILCEWYNSPLVDRDGNVIGVASLVRDITKQHIAEKSLKESEQRYRAVVEHVQEVVFHIDTKGCWTFLNSAWTQITGYTVEESMGKSFTDFIFPEFLADAFEHFHLVMTGNLANLPTEVRARTKLGECRWLELRANLHRNEDGEIVGLFGTLGDISEQKKHQDALLRMVSLLTSTIEATADGILAVDLAGTIVSYNRQFTQMVSLNHDAWLYQDDQGVFHQIAALLTTPDALTDRLQQVERDLEWAGGDRMELVDGRILEIFSQPQWLNREVIGRVWSFRDVTDREKAIEDLRLQREYLRSIIDTDPNLIFIKDEHGVFQLVNQAYADAYGTTIDDLIGKNISEFIRRPEEAAVFQRTDRDVLTSLQDRFFPEMRFTNAQGEIRWLQTSKKPIYSPDKRTYHVLGIAADITDRKNFAEQISHQALHDRLTGLPNRALFMDRLQRALAESQTTGAAIAVLSLDLDHFRVVNESLGHHVGDMLLIEIARRLRSCVAPGDTVARLDGDEFTLVLEQTGDRARAVRAAEKIVSELNQVMNLSGREIVPTVSIGVEICRGDATSADEALRRAETAMYQAKSAGRAGYAVYEREMNRMSIERLELQADLHRAVHRNELEIYYQPIVALGSGRIVGTEALLRWNHPKLGMISPTQFIPIAEETGLVIPLGDWVLREACIQTSKWRAECPGYGDLSVSVNVSLHQLTHEDFVDRACAIIDSTGLDPSSVKLEITESVMMRDVETMITRLERLKAYGARLAIDDFGAGYSCMAYLIRLPVDTIKIDRIFVSRLGERTQDDAVLESIVNLAKALNLSITAEGIENERQLRRLQLLGAHHGQGYYFSPPAPANVMRDLLAAAPREAFAANNPLENVH